MMLKQIAIGVYYPGDSLLHRLQARTKLLLLLMLLVALILAGHFYWDFTPYLVALVLVIFGIASSGISWREIWRRLWLLVLIVTLTTSLGLLVPVSVTDSGRPLYVLPTLVLTPQLLWFAFLGSAALVGLYLVLTRLPLPTLQRPVVRKRLRRLRGIGLLLAFILASAVIYAFVAPNGILAYMLTYDTLWYSSIFLCLFLILYPCSLLLTMTTSPVA